MGWVATANRIAIARPRPGWLAPVVTCLRRRLIALAWPSRARARCGALPSCPSPCLSQCQVKRGSRFASQIARLHLRRSLRLASRNGQEHSSLLHEHISQAAGHGDTRHVRGDPRGREPRLRDGGVGRAEAHQPRVGQVGEERPLPGELEEGQRLSLQPRPRHPDGRHQTHPGKKPDKEFVVVIYHSNHKL